MHIDLTPEEVKALYAYIYGGIDSPEEYQLGAQIHDSGRATGEQEIDARIVKDLDDVWEE